MFNKKKFFLKISQNSQESTCVRASLLIELKDLASNFIKKETLAQVRCYEFCEIFMKTFFMEHLQATASVSYLSLPKFGVYNPCWKEIIIFYKSHKVKW